MKKIETRTATIDERTAALEAQLADPATYNGPTGEMMKLGQQQADLRRAKRKRWRRNGWSFTSNWKPEAVA